MLIAEHCSAERRRIYSVVDIYYIYYKIRTQGTLKTFKMEIAQQVKI